ncbi:hypothetical protein BUY46_11335 [Staphylococcus devriesei]|nr:hypothetical protein BUY46_11335 [Staphylococcus devriesei]
MNFVKLKVKYESKILLFTSTEKGWRFMSKSKIRLIFNIFVGVLFLAMACLLLFTDIPDTRWSIGFLIIVMIIYTIRDIVAPKKKKNMDEDNN